MPALPAKSPLESRDAAADSAAPAAAPPASRRERSYKSRWWAIPNFRYLLLWWVAVLGYYVVLNSISGRYHKDLIDLDAASDAWFAILASGLIGAFYAKRSRPLWFLISVVLATLILLVMLLALGTLKRWMNA